MTNAHILKLKKQLNFKNMENTLKTKEIVVEFDAKQSLQLENSFTILKSENDIKLHVTVGINNDEYGWFEFYDIETGGDEWYAEGGLWFKDGELTMYDGVFALPDFILDKLVELGKNVDEIRETLND
jgi:hypothetical protein